MILLILLILLFFVIPLLLQHGFTAMLPAAAEATLLGKGKHVLEVHAIGTPSCGVPTALSEGSEFYVCDGKQC